MGYLCAEKDANDIATQKFHIPTPKEWIIPHENPDVNLVKQDLDTLRSTMWNYVGLMRSRKHLMRAEKILRHLHNEIDTFYKGTKPCQELIDLRNGVRTALLIAYAALQNKRSVGCHYLTDV